MNFDAKLNASVVIQHIYEDGELELDSTCRNFRQVQQEGNRMVTREIPFYNLDMIISLGYRVRSVVATRFRQWPTKRLNEYFVKGFTMDDERLKKPTWKPLSHSPSKHKRNKHVLTTQKPPNKRYSSASDGPPLWQ